MSAASEQLRSAIDNSLNALEMVSFNNGFEAAVDGLDELSNKAHNEGAIGIAETLRWAAKELRGENVEAN